MNRGPVHRGSSRRAGRPLRKRRTQQGQAAIIVALAGIGLLAMAGLALDGGYEVGKYRQAQNGADSGSLAAARANVRSLGATDGCTVAPGAVAANNVLFRSCTGAVATGYRPSAAGFSGDAALATINAGVNVGLLASLVQGSINGSLEVLGAHGSTFGGSTPAASGTVDATSLNESVSVTSSLLPGLSVGASVASGAALYQCSSSASGAGSRDGPYGSCPPGTVSSTVALPPLVPPLNPIPVITDLCAQLSQVNGTVPASCLPPLPTALSSQYVASTVSPAGVPLQVGGDQAINVGLTGLAGLGVTATGVSIGSSQGQGICVDSAGAVAPGSCASVTAAAACVSVTGDAATFVGTIGGGGGTMPFSGTITGQIAGQVVTATLSGSISQTTATGTLSGGASGIFTGSFTNGQLSGTLSGTVGSTAFRDVLVATANGTALSGTVTGSANAICLSGLRADVAATAVYDPIRQGPAFDTVDRCSAGTITYISGGTVVATDRLSSSCGHLTLGLAGNLIQVSGPSWTVSPSCSSTTSSRCSVQFCLLQVSVAPSVLNPFLSGIGAGATLNANATVCLVSADASINVAPFTFTDGYYVVAHAPMSTYFLRVLGAVGADPAAGSTARVLFVSNVVQPNGAAYAVPWISTAQKGTCNGQRSTLQIGCTYAIAGPGIDQVVPGDSAWDGRVAAASNPVGSYAQVVDGPGPAPQTFLNNHATYYLLPVLRNGTLQVLYYAVFLPQGSSGSGSGTTYYGQLIGGAANDFVFGIAPQIVQAETVPANVGPGYDPNVGEAAVAVKLTKN